MTNALFFAAVALVVEPCVKQPVAQPVVLRHADVVEHRHVVPQADVLKGAGHAHGCDLMRLKACIVGLAIKNDLPFRGVVKARSQIEYRGFARAVGANKAHKGVVFHGDGKIR